MKGSKFERARIGKIVTIKPGQAVPLDALLARAGGRLGAGRGALRRRLADAPSLSGGGAGSYLQGMSENSFDARAELEVGGRDLRDLPARRAAVQVRRRAAAVLAEGPAREPAAQRGRRRASARRTSRRSRRWDHNAEPVEGDRLHARARADAGLHRRARRRRPRRDARRDGRPRRRPDQDQPARARPSWSSTTPCRSTRSARATRSASTPSASSSATRSATRSCAGARARSRASRSSRRTPASSTRSTSSTSRAWCSRTTATLYPDTLVGTDSHTTMINGLGVLGWGVGGIEAEAAMLGQPMSMLIPHVVGFKLARRAARGRDRDRPRAHRHPDAARARRGRQVRRVLRPRRPEPAAGRPRDDRQHVARSSARPARSSRSTRRRCATSSSPAARRSSIELVEAYAARAGPVARRGLRGADVLRDARARPRRGRAVAGRPEAPAGPRLADRVQGGVPAARSRTSLPDDEPTQPAAERRGDRGVLPGLRPAGAPTAHGTTSRAERRAARRHRRRAGRRPRLEHASPVTLERRHRDRARPRPRRDRRDHVAARTPRTRR